MKTDEKGQIKLEVLDGPWPEPRMCKICKTEELILSNMIYELPEFWPRHPSVPNARIPVAALLCPKCGNIILFDAITLKIIDENGKWLIEKKV